MSYTPRTLRRQRSDREDAFRLQDLILTRRNYDLLAVIARGVDKEEADAVINAHTAGLLIGPIPDYRGEIDG